jgi:uncharacterized protein YjbI with pentapeptide repeats
MDLIEARESLRADCSRCAALCCVAPAFAVSADFAIGKPAGRPCPLLRPDFACNIHDGLREQGFPGCAVFDCFGAGQQVVQVTFGGRNWRQAPELAESMFAVFAIMRQLKELLWYLAEGLALLPDGPLRDEVKRAQEQTETLVSARPDQLGGFNAAAHRQQFGPLLERVSEAARAGVRGRAPDRKGADLTGAKLHGADLHGASLRGAYLLGADLRRADLRQTDLLGADLRGADLRAARLDGSLFLTQPQIDAATGDDSTTLPASLVRPRHWPATTTPAMPSSSRQRRRRW